jgi:Tol biopolymer transport system component
MLRVHRQFIVLRYTVSHTASGKRRRAETLYRVARKSADLLRMALVTSAAMLAICLLALVETTNTAEAKDSLPENGKIAFESFPPGRAGRIYTVEPDGSNVRQLIPVDGTPKWSPDGTELLLDSSTETAVMSADGSNMRIISNATLDEADPTWPAGAYPTWSADGTRVAWSNNRLDLEKGESSDYDIFMVDLDNSNKTTLRRTPKVSERFADFSPDGSRICFTHHDIYVPGRNPSGIYVRDVHRSDPNLLFEDDTPGICDWSPDGKKIVFSTTSDPYHKESRKAEVYIINADGSGRTALTSNSAADANPAWSPDGTKIVFSSDRDGGDVDLYTMDTDGSDVAQVTNLPRDEGLPDWQPLTPESRSMTVHPPDTGGPSLLLVASALFFSVGSLLYAVVRRRM